MKRIFLKLVVAMAAVLTGSMAYAQFGAQPAYAVTVKEVNKDARDKVSFEITFDLPNGIHVYTTKKQFFAFNVSKSIGLGKPAITLPALKRYTDQLDKTSEVLSGKQTVTVTLPYTGTPGSKWSIEGAMSSQGCDDTTCYAPQDDPFSAKGKIPADAVVATTTVENAPVKEPKKKNETPKSEPGALIDAGHGFVFLDADVDKLPFDFIVKGQADEGNGSGTILKYVLFAFLGGLILNVMPCVLPVLSIKAMSIVNSAHKDRKQIFMGSMAYTAGIMVSFLALATLVAVAKAAGQQAGWGDQMQSPVFVVVLFIIIWVFSLSLFDVFMIQLPGMQAASKASSTGGHLGSFLSGIFAVLLSTPCTAPLLGSAVGFLFAQSIPIVFISFIAIGLGLALPFIMLGLTPSAMKFIPKPGAWMNIFREVMGFLLIGTAVFLAYILQSQLGENFFSFLIFIVPLTFSCWLYGKAAGPGVEMKRQLMVCVIVLGITIGSAYWLIKIPEARHVKGNLTAELMRKALFEEDRMVFIDFGADWCATCKVFENTILYSKDVQDEFKKKNVLLLKGDFTNRDPKMNAWLQRFSRAGVPLYVILRPGASIVADRLPDAITRQMVIDALNKK